MENRTTFNSLISKKFLFALGILALTTNATLFANGNSNIKKEEVKKVNSDLSSQNITVYISYPGNHNWTFVLQDSDGNVIDIRNNVNETDTLLGLKKGTYSIWELNPLGLGRVYSVKIEASSSNVRYVALNNENDSFDFIHEAVDIQSSSLKDK